LDKSLAKSQLFFYSITKTILEALAMKKELKLKLFGPPKVVFNQKDIRFSFSKMEALFYYLAVMGQVNRDEIAGILWGDKENQVARKNLRKEIH